MVDIDLLQDVDDTGACLAEKLGDARARQGQGRQRQVAEKVAQIEFTLQEARNTLSALQHERELAERIEKGIKQLRAAGKPDEGKKSASA